MSNNPKDSYTQRKSKHKPLANWLSLNCSFDEIKKTDANSIEEKIKKLFNDLKELASEIINYKEKKMIPLTDKEIYSLWKSKSMSHMQRKVLLW